MGRIADVFKNHLDQENIRYTYYEPTENRNEAIKISYSGKNADSISVTFFFDKNDKSVNVKSFTVAKIPAEKIMDVYVVLNELNYEYRWVKFYVDSDNEVTVSGDAIVDAETAGKECEEILIRYISIIDEVYPRIMKVIWS